MLNKNCQPKKFRLARRMRRESTAAENTFWQAVRRKALGVRVRRQEVVLGFIADFYCPKAKLIIEIDGSSHAKKTLEDAQRDAIFKQYGFSTLRIPNERVLEDLPRVLSAVGNLIRQRMAT